MPEKGQIRRIIELPKNESMLASNPNAMRDLLRLVLSQLRQPAGRQQTGDYLRLNYIEQTFKPGNGASTVNFTTQIPANSLVIGARMNFDTALSLTTAVKIGLGSAGGGPSQYLLSGTTLTKNTKNRNLFFNATFLTAATTDVSLNTCATGGTAAGSFATGGQIITAGLLFITMDDIQNA